MPARGERAGVIPQRHDCESQPYTPNEDGPIRSCIFFLPDAVSYTQVLLVDLDEMRQYLIILIDGEKRLFILYTHLSHCHHNVLEWVPPPCPSALWSDAPPFAMTSGIIYTTS